MGIDLSSLTSTDAAAFVNAFLANGLVQWAIAGVVGAAMAGLVISAVRRALANR